jgi:hypothetical protein
MRRPCLIGASVTKLLNYSCLYATALTCSTSKPQTCINYLNMYHPNVVDETKLSCSKAISSVFECSRQNFMWQRMLSRARLKDWAALKDLAIDRGIFLTTTGSIAPRNFQLRRRHSLPVVTIIAPYRPPHPFCRELHWIWAICRSMHRARRAQGRHRCCGCPPLSHLHHHHVTCHV